jgi:type IV pilus assembly protein PilY1
MLISTRFKLSGAFINVINRLCIATVTALMTLGISAGANAVPVQYPLFISNPVKPIMMLNMSRDHQLFFKLYDDYSDIVDMRTHITASSNSSTITSASTSSSAAVTNPNYGKSGSDGIADKTYIHQYRYYGYFDSDKCYTYANGLFSPSRFIDKTTRYCNYGGVKNEWSGNLLNWATMTRLDAVRKILYGGKRSVDATDQTVLERAFIPEDAHAFAKYYNGSDIYDLTPFADDGLTMGAETMASGITFCNATSPSGNDRVYSQVVSANTNVAPRLKVARGNFSLWASNEGYQCRWDNGSNDNNAALTGINAYSSSPKRTGSSISEHGALDALGSGNYSVRVEVCVAKFIKPTDSEKATINPTNLTITNEEGCREYPNGKFKPIGLLQEYGEKGTINFGLMTGSYGKNKSGGVLRKNVGVMTDEINLTTGQLNTPANTNTIIGTLDRLTIYGYNFANGQYNDSAAGGDNCPWGLGSFVDGRCSNWGNPQSEIYLESLRYLAGKAADKNFSADDSALIPGLNTATWVKPVTNYNYCAPLNILQFNASTSSYDHAADQLNATDIGLADIDAETNAVGTAEGISGQYFVGVATGTEDGLNKQLCTPKTISNLSTVHGTCPDAPRLEGSFKIAGLAHHARKTGISMTGLTATDMDPAFLTPKVHTYGVALAPAVPSVVVPVPGYALSAKKNITILPACRSTNTNGNCAIVDFKIVSQNHVGNTYTGSLYVDWEDSEQGGDYDQDMWGLIKYSITNTSATVETRVFAQATDHRLGFGYVIGGTENDGFKVQSGINNFEYGTFCTATAGSKCNCRGDWKGSCTDTAEAVWRPQSFPIASTPSDIKSLKQPLYYAAKWGGYSDDTSTNDSIKNKEPSTYFYATDPRELANSMREAFNSIAERGGSSSGVATNSTSLNGSSYLYQAVFNSDTWRGGLNAYKFDSSGKLERVAGKPKLEKSTDDVQPDVSDRDIYTYNGTSLVNFAWGDLTTTQKDYLVAPTDPVGDYANAEKRLNWLRGSETNESGADALRSRTVDKTKRNIIGDIVNSTPVYVGDTNFRFHRLSDGGGSYPAYLAFKKTLTPKVIVGANDGKLHVFHANTLNELYAYVPNLVFPKLRYVTAANYGRPTNPHQYLLDGPLTVSDVYDKDNKKWRTIVVGTLGGGGRGVFALDVSDEDRPEVLFEISAQDSRFSGLGYVLGKPIVMPLKNGRWAAIFGNGSDNGSLIPSVTTESRLFVVDIFDPNSETKIISTGAGRGLSAPAVLPDANGVAKAVYAGDLNGHMWKFDLSDMSLDSDALSAKVKLVFHATTDETPAKDQPITAAPTLGINSAKGNAIAIYFGTGKYFEEEDHITVSTNPHQSFYAITESSRTVERGKLAKKTIGTDRKVTLNTPIDWKNQDGWYLDFDQETEERVITKSLLIADKLVFTTIVPSIEPCAYGGKSWLMETPAVGNKFVNYQVLQDGATFSEMTTAALGFGVSEDAAAILLGDIHGEPDDVAAEDPPKTTGRQSWRELD